ncbi:LamG domain-containing protein [Candidatus Calescamantes bacterium]|nr:LamG domain-containing protein [Candidatus Calescamantes bacterium]
MNRKSVVGIWVLVIGGFMVISGLSTVIAEEGKVDSALVGYWNFDKVFDIGETEEKVVKDASENENHGMAYTVNVVSGKFGSALEFNGKSSCVEIEHDESLNIQKEITIEAWFKIPSWPPSNKWPVIVGKGSEDYLLFFDRTHIPQGLGFKIVDESSATHYVFIPISEIPIDTWCFVVATYDGSKQKIYLNGELKDTSNWEGTIRISHSSLYIGGGDTDHYFKGTIDEVKIYNRCLSADEILKKYKSGMKK